MHECGAVENVEASNHSRDRITPDEFADGNRRRKNCPLIGSRNLKDDLLEIERALPSRGFSSLMPQQWARRVTDRLLECHDHIMSKGDCFLRRGINYPS